MSLTSPSQEEEYRDASGKATLKLAAQDHVSRLHPAERYGRVSVVRTHSGNWQEESFALSDLPDVLPALAGEVGVYISQQRFRGWRRVANLNELGAMYVDLDYHKRPKLRDMHPLGVLEDALIVLERAQIPRPTIAIFSGRGLYLLWIHEAVTRKALPRWNACQKYLWEVLKPLGADRASTDAARVLRLPGSVNGKSGLTVEPITPPGEIYGFENLCSEILPIDRADLHDIRIQRARSLASRRARKPREGRGEHPQGWNGATLWEGRLSDLQRLRELRFMDAEMDDYRDRWLFIAGVAMSWIAIPQVLQRELYALAREAGGWTDAQTKSKMREVFYRTRQAAQGQTMEYAGLKIDPRYRFRNSTVIDWLEITSEEEAEMQFFISDDTRRRRQRERERERRRDSGMMERSEYLSIADHNRREAVRLRSEGHTQRQIADTLNLSTRHVKRLLKGVETEGDMSVRLYAGSAVPLGHPVGMDARQSSAEEVEEFRGEENAPKSELKSFPPKERPAAGDAFPGAEEVRRTWEESESHPLSCDCLECSSTTPRYVRMA